MKISSWSRVALLSAALLGPAAGCGGGGTTTVQRATSRIVRGKVPVRTGNDRITRVVAINARTRQTIGSAVPGADGTFTINNVPVGAFYRLHAIAGRRSIPIVFKKAPGAAAKTNVFRIGTRSSPRAGTLDAPIDVGDLTSAMMDGEEVFDTPDNSAPNLQEDFDEDGMPDATDNDADGDGAMDAMDNDLDNDGLADAQQLGDQDGDGLTNESDPDQDGDGMPNAADPDNDNDGTPDAMDTSPNGDTGGDSSDSDGDGIPNTEDSTTPDDGVPTEGGGETDGGAGDEDAAVKEDGGP